MAVGFFALNKRFSFPHHKDKLTDRELKKLDKSELLEILIDLSDENEALRRENAELLEKLEKAENEALRERVEMLFRAGADSFN